MAQYYLGRYYHEGFGCQENHELAVIYYQLAADQNDPKAQYRLALHYLDQARYIGPELDLALSYLKLAADNGHRDAQYRIATFYSTGCGYEKNIQKAIYYYSLAASQSHPMALNNLACLYFQGTDLTLDYEKAFKMFVESASYHFPLAHRNAGNCLLNGLGVEKDLFKALEHFEEYERLAPEESAYELLSYQCKAEIAIAYRTGDGLEKNMKLAFNLLTQLTDEPPKYTEPQKIYTQLCIILGFLHQNGYVDQTIIIPINLKKAFELFQKAELHQIIATYQLAQFSRTGLTWQNERLVHRNVHTYSAQLKRAAKEGLKIACIDLAYHYEKGLNGPQRITIIRKNLKKAIFYYTKGGRKDDASRCLNLLMASQTDRIS